MQLLKIPPSAILAHYKEITPSVFAVVTVSGKILAPSFYELREKYTASIAINGLGSWVVLIPRAEQISLF